MEAGFELNQLTHPNLRPEAVRGLLGAGAVRHVLYLMEGQYLYQFQAEDGSLQYKFLSAQSVRLAFSQETVDSGWLSPAICRWGYSYAGQWAVMFIPPMVQSLLLYTNAARVNDLEARQPTNENGKVEFRVALPGLVLVGVGQHYYLWAVKAKSFSPELVAYHAPLPNLYADGRICWGSNQVGPVTAQSLEAAWKLFISSPFNSHLVQGKSKRFPQDILVALTDQSSKRRKSYSLSDLLPLQGQWERQTWTINRLIERLITREQPGL